MHSSLIYINMQEELYCISPVTVDGVVITTVVFPSVVAAGVESEKNILGITSTGNLNPSD